MPFGSTSKRARSSSSTAVPDEDPKRRFSFTPFAERRNNPQRALTERKPSRKSNKVISYDNELCTDSASSSVELKRRDSLVSDNFQCSGRKTDRPVKDDKMPKPKPELRAPLMNIKMTKPMLSGISNPRRESLALNKEQVVTIDAYRPRRETLAIHREQPTAVPFKPRREHFTFEKGEPVLESFRPKRDSILIHKKMQPEKDVIRCVEKQVYSDCENIEPNDTSTHVESSRKLRHINPLLKSSQQHARDVDWSLEFKSFGKASGDFDDNNKTSKSSPFHIRRMSTGSIARLRPLVSIDF